MKSKSIGITTFHKAHNYGAILQVFALKTILEKNENSVEFINYTNKDMLKQYKVIKIDTKNIKKRIKSTISSIIFLTKNWKRCNSFKNFINRNIPMTIKYKSIEELKKNPPNKDYYITGSDQVWNPDITKGLSDFYFLNFGKDSTKRISYAASIGKNTLGEEDYKNKILNIDNISVREETAQNLLKDVIDKEIEVVLDPTLLISGKEWEKLLNIKNQEKEPYILAYRVEANEEYVKILDALSKKTNLKIIDFEKRKQNSYNTIRSEYTSGPEEFVRLIKNAEYIVTTSFHATVFSILFHKNFFIVPHKTTGSRVIDLIEKLKIPDRIYYTLEELKNVEFTKEISYKDIDIELNKERDKSLRFLKNAINNEVKD